MRRPRPTTLRVRLAAGSALVAAVVLSALALLISMQVRDAAAMTATQLALDDLRPFATDLRAQTTESPDPSAPGLLVIVQAPDGREVRNSMPAVLARNARRVTGVGEVEGPSGDFQVVSSRVTTPGGTWRLWAARDLSSSDAVLQGIRLTLLIGTPVAVLATAIAAWLVATAALQPVERLRRSADRLRRPGAVGSLPERGANELADLAATLNGLIDDLRRSAEHERRVTADAAHELRTPLAVLAAQVELAERHPATADLPAIRTSVDRLVQLTDALLALSRMDDAHSEPPPSTPIRELVTEAMHAVDRARVLAAEEVLIDLELGDDLDEAGSAAIDATGFGRVLTNLLANSVAAGPASRIIVRLDRVGDVLRIDVEDDGAGLPADFLPFAFDRFARPERSRSSGSGGAGLGLALVRRLAERSGGSADLRNREPRGAVASVHIPARPGRAG